ncbi:MalY/PatB family protein [Embleya hyalina]|uniref:cysteine-S-conjugate beta-lyase n=1 Tax=Embleya hyalina TaxID=516124 RepID=A0A401Z1T9_9ACTN|nr:aminotransferase class I/II-fold pyridoxal phosphate-dependent enzyme [Embleya hyalina]GCE00804.1 aminotransferase [Embleya hyalina]
MTSVGAHSMGMRLSRVTEESLWALGSVKWTETGPDRLGAGAAEMDFGVAPPVATALTEAIETGLVGYLPTAVDARLREACATWQFEEYGWRVAPGDVRVLPDVLRALHVAIERFSRPMSPVIVPTPAYMPFLTIPRLLGRDVLEVPLRENGREGPSHDLDALDDAFAAGGHLLVLCNPHNPTGRVLELDELRAVATVVERHGGRVFADEIHAPITYMGHRHIPYASTSTQAAEHTVTAVSASKAWNLAGLKCAQMVLSNDADRERWAGLGRLDTDGASTLGVLAATAAYRHGRGWLDEVLVQLDENRHRLGRLVRALPGVRYSAPQGTFLGWLDFRRSGLPWHGLADFFDTRAGVSVVDGAACGRAGTGFVRLNFATAPSILDRVAERMADAMREANTP